MMTTARFFMKKY